MQITKKPTRKDLLKVISRLQGLIGSAQGIYDNDIATNRADRLHLLLEEAFDLCIQARSFDPPGDA